MLEIVGFEEWMWDLMLVLMEFEEWMCKWKMLYGLITDFITDQSTVLHIL
jgi:hypothetical protein